MNVTSLTATQPKMDPVAVEKIANSKTLDEKQKVSELTRQFEAVLLRQILAEAHKPVFKSNLESAGGVSSAIYKDMMISQMAESISSSRAVGLAKSLETQVSRAPENAAKNLNNPDATKAQTAAPTRLSKAKGL